MSSTKSQPSLDQTVGYAQFGYLQTTIGIMLPGDSIDYVYTMQAIFSQCVGSLIHMNEKRLREHNG